MTESREGFVYVGDGLWFGEDDPKRKPFSSRVLIKNGPGCAGVKYDGPMRELKCKCDGYYYVRKSGEKDAVRWHRILYDFDHGPLTEGMQVDHINHVRDDNGKDNLRSVTQSQNKANSRKYKSNSSGFTGVYRRKTTGNWYAVINFEGKQINLGTYASKAGAIKARQRAEKEVFGEFRCKVGG